MKIKPGGAPEAKGVAPSGNEGRPPSPRWQETLPGLRVWPSEERGKAVGSAVAEGAPGAKEWPSPGPMEDCRLHTGRRWLARGEPRLPVTQGYELPSEPKAVAFLEEKKEDYHEQGRGVLVASYGKALSPS